MHAHVHLHAHVHRGKGGTERKTGREMQDRMRKCKVCLTRIETGTGAEGVLPSSCTQACAVISCSLTRGHNAAATPAGKYPTRADFSWVTTIRALWSRALRGSCCTCSCRPLLTASEARNLRPTMQVCSAHALTGPGESSFEGELAAAWKEEGCWERGCAADEVDGGSGGMGGGV